MSLDSTEVGSCLLNVLCTAYVVIKISTFAYKHLTLPTAGENTLALISDLK